jgi:hypothetical protein
MAVKLHRCRFTWVPFDTCSRVQRALDDEGIPYELVVYPWARWKRDEIVALSGQKYYPVIELEDGSVYRDESRTMAATIRAGKLAEKGGQARAPG